MDMYIFFEWLGTHIQKFITEINKTQIYFGSQHFGLVNCLFLLVMLSMIVTVFWKGAKG